MDTNGHEYGDVGSEASLTQPFAVLFVCIGVYSWLRRSPLGYSGSKTGVL